MAKGTPKSVKDAAQKADALHKEIYGDAESDTKVLEAEAPAENDPGEGGDIQPVEPQAQNDSTGDTSDSSEEGGATVTDITPPSEEGEAPKPATPAEDWEQKYKALQGKYNAEVPRMAGELREMRDQLKELMEAKAAPKEPTEATAPEKNVVSDQDIVDYGEDLLDLIRRVAQDEARRMTSSLTPTIEEIRGQVTKSAQKQATTTIYSKLDADVQDWREINKSPEFLEWLATRDPYVGEHRKNLLAKAFEHGDADRVAAFFKGYKAERQAVTPAPTPSPGNTEPAAQPKSQVSLDQLAGPSGGPTNGAVNTQPQQSPQWTRAQVGQFYNDVNAGVYAKNPEQKAQIEASIATAMREGRIQ